MHSWSLPWFDLPVLNSKSGTTLELQNNFVGLLESLRFFQMIQVFPWFRPISASLHLFSTISVSVFVSGVSVFGFASAKKYENKFGATQFRPFSSPNWRVHITNL
jgi:hypothetical protein